jgi:membrane protease YdiL (CAAX protease family)
MSDVENERSAAVSDSPSFEAAMLPARKPRVWTVFAALGAAIVAVIVAQIVGAVGLVLWFFSQGGTVQRLQAEILDLVTSPGPFIFINGLSQLAIAATALAAAYLSPQPLLRRLGLVRPIMSAGSVVVLVLGVIIPTAVGLGLALALAEVLEPDQTAKKLYEQMTVEWALPFILYIALAPGFCEELLFRGYMQRRLIERWGPAAAILFASVIFALFHVTPHAVLFALPVGIWLGMLAWRTGSIWPGAVCHAALNGLWNVRNVGQSLGYFPEATPAWLAVLLGAVGLATFAWSLWLMFGRPAKGRAGPLTDTRATGALPGP